MSRCRKHELIPLYVSPDPETQPTWCITYGLRWYGYYRTCPHCGAIGSYSHHALHRFRWQRHQDWAEERRQDAANWKALLQAERAFRSKKECPGQ